MKPVHEAFLKRLFEPDEQTCFTDSPYGYKVSSFPSEADEFFCINPLDPVQDRQPTKDWHRADLPRRADVNVIAHRNFLLELDNMDLWDQLEYVRKALPVTSVVFSGSKSLHFIISLTEPVSADKYREIAKRICTLLPEIDQSCKNPSRLSRLPGVVRKSTNKLQELWCLDDRVTLAELESLLPALPEPRKIVRNPDGHRAFVSALVLQAINEPDTVMSKYNIQGRNAFFYWLGCRLEESEVADGYRYVETAYENLNDVSDFELEEALNAARVRSNSERI